MKVLPYGDQALLVRFQEKIDQTINQKVLMLYELIKRENWVKYLIPSYQSLTVGIQTDIISLNKAIAIIENIPLDTKSQNTSGKHMVIPVCYEGVHAPDMPEVEKHTGLNTEDIIDKHAEETYHVYMLGFVAGFPYMGTLPSLLHCPRKSTPRLKVPKGSVGLAGAQTGIYPTEAPGGWQIIGQTPIPLFDPQCLPPNTLNPGDRVSFRPISTDEFQLISIKVETGIYEFELAHE